MLFVLSSLVVIAGGAMIAAMLGERRLHLWVLTVALFWYLHIVVAGRILSVFGLLGSRPAWLLADLTFAMTAAVVWHRRGSPRLRPPIRRDALRDTLGPSWLLPVTIGMAAVVVLLYAGLLAASVLIPQNLDDVMTAYLARVGYWIQQNDLSAFATSTYNSVQVSYPANAQLPILRSIVLSRSSRFVGLEQWTAPLLAATAIFGLSRALGARRTAAYLCAGAWLLIPAVGVQTGVALTDLVSVSGVLTTLLFGYVGWVEQRWSALVLSSLAFGLALGTKQTFMFVAPGYAVLCVAALLSARPRWKLWARWLAVTVPAVVLLGLIDYLRNWSYFGHPLGEPDSFTLFAAEATTSERVTAMSSNMAQATLDVFLGDLNPGIAQHLRCLWRVQTRDALIGTGRYLERGQPWMGFFVAATMLVGIVLAIYSLVRRRNLHVLVPMTPALLFIVAIFWVRTNYSGAFSRYLLTPGALFLVVAAVGLSQLRFRRRVSRALGGITALIAIVGMASQALYTVANNGVRPLAGAGHVWSASTVEVQALAAGYPHNSHVTSALRYFEHCFGEVGRVGIMLPSKFPQAFLFGYDYRREVTQFVEPFPSQLDPEFMARERLPVMIVETELLTGMSVDLSRLRMVTFRSLVLISSVEPVPTDC